MGLAKFRAGSWAAAGAVPKRETAAAVRAVRALPEAARKARRSRDGGVGRAEFMGWIDAKGRWSGASWIARRYRKTGDRGNARRGAPIHGYRAVDEVGHNAVGARASARFCRRSDPGPGSSANALVATTLKRRKRRGPDRILSMAPIHG